MIGRFFARRRRPVHSPDTIQCISTLNASAKQINFVQSVGDKLSICQRKTPVVHFKLNQKEGWIEEAELLDLVKCPNRDFVCK